MMNNVFVYNYHTAKVCFIEIKYMVIEKRDQKIIFFSHTQRVKYMYA